LSLAGIIRLESVVVLDRVITLFTRDVFHVADMISPLEVVCPRALIDGRRELLSVFRVGDPFVHQGARLSHRDGGV
jgi:hypothetical protein